MKLFGGFVVVVGCLYVALGILASSGLCLMAGVAVALIGGVIGSRDDP